MITKRLTIKIITIFLLMSISAKSAFSICCDMADLADPIQIARITGLIALDEMAASLMEEKIENLLGLAGDNTGNEKLIQASMKSYEATAKSVAATLKQHAITKATLNNNKMFSPLSQSSFACCSNGLVGIPVGQANERLINDDIYESILSRNIQYLDVTQQTQELKKMWTGNNAEEILKGSNVFPINNTLSEEELTAGLILTNFATNPIPHVLLSSGQSNNSAGEKYEIANGIKSIRLGPSQKALASILSANAPVYDMQDWAEQLYLATGRTGTPASVRDGMLSANAVIDLRVDARYANPTYGLDLHRKTENGLIRELAIAKAIKLEILERRLKVARMTRTVMATKLAVYLDLTYDNALKGAHDRALIHHAQ